MIFTVREGFFTFWAILAHSVAPPAPPGTTPLSWKYITGFFFFILTHFLNSDQEMGDTKVSIKGLHEDMRIFASEVTEESKSATDRVKKLGTYISLKKNV